MSYDNAKACAVVETTSGSADVSQNMINVDQKASSPDIYNPEANFKGKNPLQSG